MTFGHGRMCSSYLKFLKQVPQLDSCMQRSDRLVEADTE